VQRVAEHERLVGVDERQRLWREQAVQVVRACVDAAAHAAEARLDAVQQRLRRRVRVQRLADPPRQLGGRDVQRAETVMQRVRAIQQLRVDAELLEDGAVVTERRRAALTQIAIQERRCGRQSSGILARRSKQPARA
jgi:hypothetical protein